MTDEVRTRYFETMLGVTAERAKDALAEALAGSSTVCVVSSRDKLEGANRELGERALALEDVFTGATA
jgi:hypothetical protein